MAMIRFTQSITSSKPSKYRQCGRQPTFTSPRTALIWLNRAMHALFNMIPRVVVSRVALKAKRRALGEFTIEAER